MAKAKPPTRLSPPEASGTFRVAKPLGDEPSASPIKRRALPSPTVCLERAMKAKTPAARAKFAKQGLVSALDVETQGLLLRQLYLGELESGAYTKAREVAEQLVALGVLPDVAHHDAARASQALGDLDAAIVHLREAVRLAAEGRTSFHLSTLGALLFLRGDAAESQAVFERALEGAESTEPLVRGQIALAKHAQDADDDAEIELAYHELLHHNSGEGYGRFVLGLLAFARGDRRAAQLYLEAFLARVNRARPAAKAALTPEITRATETLARIAWN